MEDNIEKTRLIDGDPAYLQTNDACDHGLGLDGSDGHHRPSVRRSHSRAYSRAVFPLADEDNARPSNITRRLQSGRMHTRFDLLLAAVAGAIAAATCLLALYHGNPVRAYRQYGDSGSIAHTVSPSAPSFPVIAMVFYGRRQNVEILDCYLKRNLVSNGGLLSRVHFIVHTTVEEDLAYLNDTLIPSDPRYTQSHITVPHMWGFNVAWQEFSDPEAVYIKIDDDVLFIGDDSIAQLVQSFELEPNAFAVAANAINEYDMAFLGYHHENIAPFLPEHTNLSTYTERTNDEMERAASRDWRPSSLPSYPSEDLAHLPAMFDLDRPAPAPVNSSSTDVHIHRWLPLPPNDHSLRLTPVDRMIYAPGTIHNNAWTAWPIAAQQHYSFLAHLDALTSPSSAAPDATPHRAYHYGSPTTGLWNTNFDRYSINFMAMRGADIHANRHNLTGDDEVKITQQIPRELGRPFLVQTRAVVAHFSYGLQYHGMVSTDVRARYKGFSEEVVCGKRWGTGVV